MAVIDSLRLAEYHTCCIENIENEEGSSPKYLHKRAG